MKRELLELPERQVKWQAIKSAAHAANPLPECRSLTGMESTHAANLAARLFEGTPKLKASLTAVNQLFQPVNLRAELCSFGN